MATVRGAAAGGAVLCWASESKGIYSGKIINKIKGMSLYDIPFYFPVIQWWKIGIKSRYEFAYLCKS